MRRMLRSVALLSAALLAACVYLPDGVQPVQNFSLPAYLGQWHEVARLDHRFERGLTQVTATYSLREDGGVRVRNKGFDTQTQQWQEAEGKAYFVEDEHTGYLKVSFFGPFYGAYIIFALDEDDQYSFVSGPDTDYLWLLSRTPTVSDAVKQHFIREAQARGFDTQALIWLDNRDANAH